MQTFNVWGFLSVLIWIVVRVHKNFENSSDKTEILEYPARGCDVGKDAGKLWHCCSVV